jgi:hypothetical protein
MGAGGSGAASGGGSREWWRSRSLWPGGPVWVARAGSGDRTSPCAQVVAGWGWGSDAGEGAAGPQGHLETCPGIAVLLTQGGASPAPLPVWESQRGHCPPGGRIRGKAGSCLDPGVAARIPREPGPALSAP